MHARPLFLSIALCAATGGCAAAPPAASESAPVPAPVAATGDEIRLPLGHSTQVNGEAFQIDFEAVVTDSRCRKGETCIWEGNATIRLSASGVAGTRILELHTSPKVGPAAAGYEGWAIHLIGLEPLPVTGRETLPGSYVATLRIVRGTAGPETQ